MNEDLYIVTGASRGRGAARAQQLLAPGVTLLGLSRGRHAGLAAQAAAAGATVEEWRSVWPPRLRWPPGSRPGSAASTRSALPPRC